MAIVPNGSDLTVTQVVAAARPGEALSELAVAGQAITVEARTLAHPVSSGLVTGGALTPAA